MMTISKVKYCFACVLLVLFFFLFGYPSVKKLFEYDTVLVKKSVPYDSSVSPLILLKSTSLKNGFIWSDYTVGLQKTQRFRDPL